MKILALDYDGVIIDSQLECLSVGFNAYLKLKQKTKLFDGEKFTFDNFDKKINENKDLVIKHNNLRVYVRDASSWYNIFYAIDNNIEIKNQEDFDNIDKLNLDFNLYVSYFYDERIKLQKENLEKWLNLNKLFPNIKKIDNLKNKFKLVIATNNRKGTIEGFLKKYNLDFDLIIDQDFSTDKTKQLEFIKNRYKVNFEDIYFVDDQIAHFSSLIKLGVKCFLAAWGYNNKEQQEEAKKLGVELVNEGDFLNRLSN